MKKFICFLMIVVYFSCNNILSMAEEDFTLDIGNVHIDATIMNSKSVASEVQIEYMNQINMHDIMAMNLAKYYDCAYELGLKGETYRLIRRIGLIHILLIMESGYY